jgi:hypothetical protein
MDTHRINVKFYLNGGPEVSGETWFRVLSSWIPTTPDEVLVDVADYGHVKTGPLTVLVGHDANYAIDNSDGRLGLVYARKQPLEGDLSVRLRTVLRATLKACRRIEADPAVDGTRFKGDECLVTFNDRLEAPNTEAAFEAVRPAVSRELEALFGVDSVSLKPEADAKRPLSLKAIFNKDLGIEALLKNVDSAV